MQATVWDLHSKLVCLPQPQTPKRKAGSSYNPSEQQVRGREMRYQGHTQDFLHVMRCTDAASNRDGLYTRSHTNSSSMSLKRLKKAHGAPHCTLFFLSVRMQCTYSTGKLGLLRNVLDASYKPTFRNQLCLRNWSAN